MAFVYSERLKASELCATHVRALQADYARYRESGYSGWLSPAFWAVALYRIQGLLRDGRPKLLLFPIRAAVAVLRRFFSLAVGIQISADAQIGPGLLVPHVGSIWVDRYCKIGSNCTIYHGCTISGSTTLQTGATIGDEVVLSCHSSIMGVLSIGDHALVAANSLVISDVPSGATAVGVPARILPAFRKAG